MCDVPICVSVHHQVQYSNVTVDNQNRSLRITIARTNQKSMSHQNGQRWSCSWATRSSWMALLASGELRHRSPWLATRACWTKLRGEYHDNLPSKCWIPLSSLHQSWLIVETFILRIIQQTAIKFPVVERIIVCTRISIAVIHLKTKLRWSSLSWSIFEFPYKEVTYWRAHSNHSWTFFATLSQWSVQKQSSK